MGNSMAVAYGMKKRKKMDSEDESKGVQAQNDISEDGVSDAGRLVRKGMPERAKASHRETLKEVMAMKKPDLMAQGGCAGDSCPGCKMCMGGYADGGSVSDSPSINQKDAEDFSKGASSSGVPSLSQAMSNIKSGLGFAEGGKVQMMTDDLVDRIMAKRANCVGDACPGCDKCVAPMSEGGMTANKMGEQADEMSAEYDDLALDDHLKSTQKDDGDHLGDAREDEDRHDIVARIMKQRSMKKNHNPRPA